MVVRVVVVPSSMVVVMVVGGAELGELGLLVLSLRLVERVVLGLFWWPALVAAMLG